MRQYISNTNIVPTWSIRAFTCVVADHSGGNPSQPWNQRVNIINNSHVAPRGSCWYSRECHGLVIYIKSSPHLSLNPIHTSVYFSFSVHAYLQQPQTLHLSLFFIRETIESSCFCWVWLKVFKVFKYLVWCLSWTWVCHFLEEERKMKESSQNPLHLKSLNHISLVCRSLEKSMNFYQDVLGFVPIRRPRSFDFDGAWYSVSP